MNKELFENLDYGRDALYAYLERERLERLELRSQEWLKQAIDEEIESMGQVLI